MLLAAIYSAVAFQAITPSRIEVVRPIRNATFNKGGAAKKRVQGGNPRTVGGVLMFDGAQDGNRQVDPQISVGGGFVVHGTNSGIVIYDKSGNYVDGVPQSEFNNGIDPKMGFCVNNRVHFFDLWDPWDKDGKKPVNISVTESADPRLAWNTYPVPAPKGVDGGGIGNSRRWVGYSFPGGDENTFVMSLPDMKKGKPVNVYHFKGSLGHPVFTQDKVDDLIFVALDDKDMVLTTVGDNGEGLPVIKGVVRKPHGFTNFGWPPASPMKGSDKKTASGDRNPKNLVIQSGSLWFSHTVNLNGRAGVQWHQFKLDGTRVQSGVVASPTNSFIQTSIGVNRRTDVLVGFQETGPDMQISARFAVRKFTDKPGTLQPIRHLVEGIAATEGGAWGDYSGSTVDGDNLLDLWTVQSFANAQGRGGTVIARVKMP
jgi:hypothetical protein